MLPTLSEKNSKLFSSNFWRTYTRRREFYSSCERSMWNSMNDTSPGGEADGIQGEVGLGDGLGGAFVGEGRGGPGQGGCLQARLGDEGGRGCGGTPTFDCSGSTCLACACIARPQDVQDLRRVGREDPLPSVSLRPTGVP